MSRKFGQTQCGHKFGAGPNARCDNAAKYKTADGLPLCPSHAGMQAVRWSLANGTLEEIKR